MGPREKSEVEAGRHGDRERTERTERTERACLSLELLGGGGTVLPLCLIVVSLCFLFLRQSLECGSCQNPDRVSRVMEKVKKEWVTPHLALPQGNDHKHLARTTEPCMGKTAVGSSPSPVCSTSGWCPLWAKIMAS